MKITLLSIFIASSAVFAEGAAASGSSASFMPMMIVMFVVLWFFMIRPEQKKQKDAVKMRDTVAKNDEIYTAGGIIGTVKKIEDDRVTIQIDKNSQMTILKSSIANVVVEKADSDS
jgi:preprotein translocase subunit YajC